MTGKVTEKYYEILREEGLSDWSVEITTSGGLCMSNEKRILTLDDDISLFLHEVAHALCNQYNESMGDKTGHHSIFADKYTDLIKKYLVTENKRLKEAIEKTIETMNEPAVLASGDWQTGLFCGLEDKYILDRYEACMYGYEQAIEKIQEWVIDDLEQALNDIGDL